MSQDKNKDPEATCPVDATARAAWLATNSKNSTEQCSNQNSREISNQAGSNPAPRQSSLTAVTSIAATLLSSLLSPWPAPPHMRQGSGVVLGHEREISTIPRASLVADSATAAPANCEREGGVSEGGNWIYPSEKMFFEAMRRKGYQGETRDMKTIVPIHNAVNERAWKEIKQWEASWDSDKLCGGPKLHSFSGISKKMSPKARINTWLGYTAPFDRHDWVVDRCGKKIDYVIDFYAGKDDGKGNGKLNFFLDVRPKLNSLEGWKMRAANLLGFV